MNQNGDESDPDPLEGMIQSMQSGLREGGPEVDFAVLVAFLDKALPPEEMEQVDKLVHSWHNWNKEYWSLYSASLDSGVDDQRDERPVPESISSHLKEHYHDHADSDVRLNRPEDEAPTNRTNRRDKWRRNGWLLLASGALAASIVIWFSFRPKNPGELTVALAPGTPRAANDRTAVEEISPGRFRMIGDEFFAKIVRPQGGYVVVVLRTDQQCVVYPRTGQSDIALNPGQELNYGPISTPFSKSDLFVIADDDPLTEQVRELVERYSGQDKNTLAVALRKLKTASRRTVTLRQFAIEPEEAGLGSEQE